MGDFVTAPIDDSAAWRGGDFDNENEWSITFSSNDIAELEAAVVYAQKQCVALTKITKEQFPLKELAIKLENTLNIFEDGRGFVLLRGLPVEKWGDEKTRLAYWGIGTHLGWAEPQDGAGELLHDVRDTGRKFGEDGNVRYFQTNQAIRIHNDGADIFALCCLRAGAKGGRSLLVSAVEVFNQIARRDPESAIVLQQPFHFDARGQHPNGDPCQVIPVFSFQDGCLSIIMKMDYIYSAQRLPDVPRLTAAQIKALELFDKVMNEPGMQLEFDLQTGDVLVASNHVVLHGRTAYTDHTGEEPGRHMLRLWLTIPNGRPLPHHYENTREFRYTFIRRMV